MMTAIQTLKLYSKSQPQRIMDLASQVRMKMNDEGMELVDHPSFEKFQNYLQSSDLVSKFLSEPDLLSDKDKTLFAWVFGFVLEQKNYNHVFGAYQALNDLSVIEEICRLANTLPAYQILVQKLILLSNNLDIIPWKELKPNFQKVDNKSVLYLLKLRHSPKLVYQNIIQRSETKNMTFIEAWRDMGLVYLPKITDDILTKIENEYWCQLKNKLNQQKLGEDEIQNGLKRVLYFNNSNGKIFIRRLSWLLKHATPNQVLKQFLQTQVEEVLGSPPNWTQVEANEEIKELYNDLVHSNVYHSFEEIASTLFHMDQDISEKDKERMHSRVIFWKNYSHRIHDIRMMIPIGQYDVLSSYEFTVIGGVKFNKNILSQLVRFENPYPICILHFPGFFVVEFYGGGSHNSWVVKTKDLPDSVKERLISHLMINGIEHFRTNRFAEIHHNPYWMYHTPKFFDNEFQIEPKSWNNIILPRNPIDQGFGSKYTKRYSNMNQDYNDLHFNDFPFEDTILFR